MKTNKILYWLPRVLCIVAILFISMFAADSFAPGLTIWQQLGGFLIHLIPSFILTGLLILAWKHEMLGGIIFTAIGIIMSPFLYQRNYNMNHSIWISLSVLTIITFPFIAVGILFIVDGISKKKQIKSS